MLFFKEQKRGYCSNVRGCNGRFRNVVKVDVKRVGATEEDTCEGVRWRQMDACLVPFVLFICMESQQHGGFQAKIILVCCIQMSKCILYLH